MLKSSRFFYFLLSLLFFIQFQGIVAAAIFKSNAYVNIKTGQHNDPPGGASDTTYILYARPGEALGTQLRHFWNANKSQHLNNPAVLNYPPHVTLTGFFPVDNPDDPDQEAILIDALEQAVNEVSGVIPITIGASIRQSKNLDTIPISSSVLSPVTVSFLDTAGINLSYLRPKPGSNYHITLREDTQGSTTTKVQQLEKKYINLKAQNLQQNTTWSLYIYKKTNGVLMEIHRIPVQG